MLQTATHTPETNLAEVDLEQLFIEQADAQTLYDLAQTYKSFGFRDKAIIEFYRLCDLRTASAEHFATLLAPMLFH